VETYRVGIIMNGVTGRMGTNQHLERSIVAIRKQGGVKIAPMPSSFPSHPRRPQYREAQNPLRKVWQYPFSTDLGALLANKDYPSISTPRQRCSAPNR